MKTKKYPTRGFGTLQHTNPKLHREIASKGGKTAQEKGTGHSWTSKEARLAGSKGGSNRWKNK